MRFLPFVLVLLLSACSPALNWREVTAQPAGLRLMLPCKPDSGARVVPFAGRDTELSMIGCNAAGMTFALASARLYDMAQADAVLAQWRELTLSHTGVRDPRTQAQRPDGAIALANSLRVRTGDQTPGRSPDGAAVYTEAMYFAWGDRVYQAVLYAPRRDAVFIDAAETFFGSLRLGRP